MPEEQVEPIPGFEMRKMEPPSDGGRRAKTPDEWAADFENTGARLRRFLLARDPYVVIAKTAFRTLFEANMPRSDKVRRIEQAETEVLIAVFLALGGQTKKAPTSPRNFSRLWKLLETNLTTFLRKQPRSDEPGIPDFVTLRARLQTIYYRNLFDEASCKDTIIDILQRCDAVSLSATGQALSVTYGNLVRINDLVIARFHEFYEAIRSLLAAEDRDAALKAIEFFCEVSPLAKRTWRLSERRFEKLEDLTMAGFQVSELANDWVFTLPRELLDKEFDPATIALIERLSIRPGELAGSNADHFYMNNPIWRRPFVAKPDGGLFVPLPHLVFSFPFQIIEGLIEGNKLLEAAYFDARAEYLEDAIATILTTAMPSASVFQSVEWDDPVTGKRYENDVVATVGNYVFLFEAKSGRISGAARRGGEKSLANNIREIFIEPGEQAARLQSYLDAEGPAARLWLKGSGAPVDLKLDKPKVVHKFSICIEHFAALTSAKSYLKGMGLVKDDTAWAPVLSIGELQMVARFLDTEISFVHYLTRRYTLEEEIDFDGDEQDLLSMYLVNRFLFNPEGVSDRKIMFQDADDLVRRPATARTDRTEVAVHGIPLSPYWLSVIKELYLVKGQGHRFDIIVDILNQFPPALEGMERKLKRWRRGDLGKNNEVLHVKNKIGSRLHVVAVYLGKSLDGDEWTRRARDIAEYAVLPHIGPSDFAAFLIFRKSGEKTFDGFYFGRGLAVQREAQA
jgi:hypothetical protein